MMKIFMTVGVTIGALGILLGIVLGAIFLFFRQGVVDAFQSADRSESVGPFGPIPHRSAGEDRPDRGHGDRLMALC